MRFTQRSYVHTATASSGLVGSKRVMVGDKVDSVKYCRPPFGYGVHSDIVYSVPLVVTIIVPHTSVP